jgi:Ser/Thr protein kinase RdoA (MazF antagonist)
VLKDMDLMENKVQNSLEVSELGNIGSCKPLAGGLESNNLLLTINSNKYVFKSYKNSSAEEIKFEISILNHLKIIGYYFPSPVTSIFYIDGYPCVVYSFLTGRELLFSDINPQTLEKIASLQALMHKSLVDFSPEGEKNRFKIFDLSFLEVFKCEYSPAVKKLIKDSESWLLTNLAVYKNISFPKSIIHEDLEMENIFIDDSSNIKFIDFGESHYAEVISDIATAIKELIINNKGLDEKLIESYLSAYNKNNSIIDKTQLKILYPLFVRRTVFMLTYFLHEQNKNIVKYPPLDKRISTEMKTLKLLLAHNDLASFIVNFPL